MIIFLLILIILYLLSSLRNLDNSENYSRNKFRTRIYLLRYTFSYTGRLNVVDSCLKNRGAPTDNPLPTLCRFSLAGVELRKFY